MILVYMITKYIYISDVHYKTSFYVLCTDLLEKIL